MHMYSTWLSVYPYFPHMSNVGERRLKCLTIGMLTICCTTTGVWKTVPLFIRSTNEIKFTHVSWKYYAIFKIQTFVYNFVFYVRHGDTPVTAQRWYGPTDRPAAIWWASGVLMPLMHTTVSDWIVHSSSPNATNAHHSTRLYCTLKLKCFSVPRNLYLFSLHPKLFSETLIRIHTQIQYPLPNTVFSSEKMAYSRAILCKIK